MEEKKTEDAVGVENENLANEEEHDRLDDIVSFKVSCKMTRRHASALACALKQIEHNALFEVDVPVGMSTSTDGHDFFAEFDIQGEDGFEPESMPPNIYGLVNKDLTLLYFDPAGEGQDRPSELKKFYDSHKAENDKEATALKFMEEAGYLNDNWLKDGLSNVLPDHPWERPWLYAYAVALRGPCGALEGFVPGFGIKETAGSLWRMADKIGRALGKAVAEYIKEGRPLPKTARSIGELEAMCGDFKPTSWMVVHSQDFGNDTKEEDEDGHEE